MADSSGYSNLNGDAGVRFSVACINLDYAIASASTDDIFCI